MGCPWDNRCCNSCEARAQLANTGFRELVNVVCLGNECEEPECGISDHAAFWLLGRDVEVHGKVRDNGDSLSLENVAIDGRAAPRRDLYGRPLDSWHAP